MIHLDLVSDGKFSFFKDHKCNKYSVQSYNNYYNKLGMYARVAILFYLVQVFNGKLIVNVDPSPSLESPFIFPP